MVVGDWIRDEYGQWLGAPMDDEEVDALPESVSGSSWFASYYERAEGVEAIQGWRRDPEEKRGLEVRPDRE